MSALNRPAAVAVAATIAGFVAGSGFAAATGWDLNLYLSVVAVAGIAAAVIVGVWVYRTYVHPHEPAVEKTETSS